MVRDLRPITKRSYRNRVLFMRNKALLWLKFLTIGRLIIGAKKLIFFRYTWNANFIVREIWTGLFFRVIKIPPLLKGVTHLLWNGRNRKKEIWLQIWVECTISRLLERNCGDRRKHCNHRSIIPLTCRVSNKRSLQLYHLPVEKLLWFWKYRRSEGGDAQGTGKNLRRKKW